MSLWGTSEGTQIEGHVSVTTNDATVTGTGTSFTSALNVGNTVIIKGQSFTVATITSNTALELDRKFFTTGSIGLGVGFELEDGTLDDAEVGGCIILDGNLAANASDVIDAGERLAFESGDGSGGGTGILTSDANLPLVKHEIPNYLLTKDKLRVVGVDNKEMTRGADNIVTITMNKNPTGAGSGGSGYASAPTITVAAPATFTFDPTADTDGDGDLTIATETFNFTNHGFVEGTAVVYNDGGGTTISGLTEGNTYFINVVDDNNFKLAEEYGSLELEAGTVGSSDLPGVGRILLNSTSGVDTDAGAQILLEPQIPNLTNVGAGTAHTLIGQTALADSIMEEVSIRLETGTNPNDPSDGQHLLLDGLDETSRGAGELILMGGGQKAEEMNNSGDTDMVYGHIQGSFISKVGSSYKLAPTVTFAAPAAKSFNAASAVDGTSITITNHGFQDGDAVTYSRNSGTAISELTDGGTFFIVSVSGDTFGLASTLGGSAISMTDGSSETHTLTGETATGTAKMGAGVNGNLSFAHKGWNIRTVGTGGRAGRIFYETLVAGEIQGDGDAIGDVVGLESQREYAEENIGR